MSGHTPGPWVIIPGGDEWSSGRIATIEPRPETMVDVNYWIVAEVNYRRDEHTANANLIAAAPDLLEALENLIDAYSRPDDRICCSGAGCGCMGATLHQQAEHYAKAAIARAKGKA